MNKEEIIKLIEEKTCNISSLEELNNLKVEFLGKKGIITEYQSMIKDIANEEKKEIGMKVNEVRTLFNTKYEEIKNILETELINKKLEEEAIDITLPSTKINIGSANILEKLIEEIEEVFMSMGYDVVDGPEIEEDKYNFEMLNIPKGHPARDAQDTFYIEGEEILLRSQTSPVQVRTMLEGKGVTPIRMICPGKTYRRDDDDATHSHQFMQIEGLLVDKDISLSGSSDSKNSNCAITKLADVGLTSSPKNIILSFNNLEKMSYDLSPFDVCSITYGTKLFFSNILILLYLYLKLYKNVHIIKIILL